MQGLDNKNEQSKTFESFKASYYYIHHALKREPLLQISLGEVYNNMIIGTIRDTVNQSYPVRQFKKDHLVSPHYYSYFL